MKLSTTTFLPLMKKAILLCLLLGVWLTYAHTHKHHAVGIVAKHHEPKLVWKHIYLNVTAYVVNKKEIGKCDVYWQHKTASGTTPQVGTAAIDPGQFAFGTRFLIPGYGPAVARDTGGAISYGHLDLVVPTCRAAYSWGRKELLVAYRRF
jgi:3D (Asp-Asp-Asp) domain-containing protein